MSASISVLNIRTCAAALALATLAGCTTVTVQPGAEGTQTTVNGAPATRAPVVEASLRSDGTPVAAPAPVAPVVAPAPPPAAPAILSGFHLQAGTFSNQTNAEGVAANIRSKTPQFASLVHVQPRGDLWRVVIGPFGTDAERMQAAGTIRSAIGSEVVNAAP
ncbi:MAG: SPOR domain-containing protein [Brachymonas sp.]|nr:SPOR domain-containing protein [Brachymonas sp.]